MFNAGKLRCAVLVVTVAILTTGCERAPETEGDGPKMEFVRIPAGSFHMGSPPSEKGRESNEGPVHEVRITKPFYMGKYEVTQAQWKVVMGTTLHQQRDKAGMSWNLKGEGPNHPMYYVSWEEAVEFCKRLGRKFRLPTEAEWEYACRAGSQTRFYYGNDPNYSELDQYAWYYGKSDNKTHPVGQKKPNAWGLYDMHGNVYEWCSDQYVILSNYEKARSVDAARPASAESLERFYRGGCWLEKPNGCRSASRRGFTKSHRFDVFGFRVVYAGRIRGYTEALEIALPQKTGGIVSAGKHERKAWTWGAAISGAVRDEAGMPLDGVHMRPLPIRDWVMREYADSEFEVCRKSPDSPDQMREYHFVARHEERNLASALEIDLDNSRLDVVLKPGVVLTGQVVDGDRNGVEKARVVVNLKTPDWPGDYLTWLDADAEGRFKFRALPPGYDYVLSARKLHYLVGQTEVHSENVRENYINGISIVLPMGKFSVSGLVVDAKGKLVPNVWVFCTGKGQAGINSQTDAEGRFKADGIFEGQVEIIANIKEDNGRWLSGSIKTEAGATNVRVVLGTGGAPPPKGRTCFPAGTNVWVNGAVVPISKVARGQTVGEHGCSVSAATFGQIEDIEEHSGKFVCRDIVLENGNLISVVDAHCFMLDSGKWIAAHELRSNLRLKTLDAAVSIKSVTTRATPFVGKVYNLKIQNSDRYMVGKDGVIVRDY